MSYPINDFKGVTELLKGMKLSTYQNTMVLSTSDTGLTTLKLDLMQSFALALCVYYIGVFLKKKFRH